MILFDSLNKNEAIKLQFLFPFQDSNLRTSVCVIDSRAGLQWHGVMHDFMDLI